MTYSLEMTCGHEMFAYANVKNIELYQHLIHRKRSPCLACGLGQISALALLTQFTTEIPLRYPLEKAYTEKAVNVGARSCAEQIYSEDF